MEIPGVIIMCSFAFVRPVAGFICRFCVIHQANTTNLALNRPAYQSSDYHNYFAALAVDGNAATDLFSNHCAHGGNDPSNWLAVDLGRSHFITHVVLTNRDCGSHWCANRLDYFKVRVTDVSPLDEPPLKQSKPNCGKYNRRASNGERLTLNCHANSSSGRYVIIQQTEGRDGFLTICELEVYGFGTENDSWFVAMVGTAVGVVVLVMLILLAIVCFHRIRRKEKRKNTAVKDLKSFQELKSFRNPETCAQQKPLGSQISNAPMESIETNCGDQQLYANTGTIFSKISVVDLPNHVKENSKYLNQEFESVPMETNAPCTYGKTKKLKSKNRFQNIIPYDHNRVVLENNDQPYSDYINASYITGVNSEKMVATQGPNDKTVDDFWKMIYQLGARVIVMLCNVEESGKVKCKQYWPHSGTQTFGKVQVELLGEENWPHFKCRYLRASKDSNSLDIIQWQFTSWPDHGVPENVRTMLYYRDKVRQSMQRDAYTVVHCSAGVGRTGCFMAIDFLLEEMKTETCVDVLGCLRALREERPQMVQSLVQYEFLYRALAAHITLNNTLISSLDFEDTYTHLQQVNSGKSELERHFDILKQETAKDPDKSGMIYPPLLLHSARNKSVYIVSEVTRPHSAGDFWKALEKNCSVLVLLDEENDFQSMFPESEAPIHSDTQTVELLNKSDRAFGTCYNLQVFSRLGTDNVYANTSNDIYANSTDNSTRNVTVLRVTSQTDAVNYNIAHSAVHSLYAELVDPLNNGISIYLQYRSKSSLPGFIVAACNALEMVDRDGEVDIFLISEELRNTDNNFIPNLKSYKLLHDIVSEHMKNTKRNS